MREISDVISAALFSYNLALLLSKQGKQAEALCHAEFAAQVFVQAGHTQYTQIAQQLIAQLRGQRR